jgi:hypothetical protein
VYDGKNGFVAAFMLAYNRHLPLRLSPDVAWLSIIQSVAKFIETSGETYRDTLVFHGDGKTPLIVGVPIMWETDDALIKWDTVLGDIRALIVANTRGDVADAFSPTFSTTTPISTTATTVCLMSALQTFFDYGVVSSCGIGEVFMDGTVDDWVQLQSRTAQLAVVLGGAGADLRQWFARLDGTLAQLVATAEHRPDVTFWQHAYSAETIRQSGGGTTLTGWFSHFFGATSGTLCDSMMLTDVPLGYVTVPFSWHLQSGKKRTFTLQAGTWTTQVSAQGVVSATPQWKVSESVYTIPVVHTSPATRIPAFSSPYSTPQPPFAFKWAGGQ